MPSSMLPFNAHSVLEAEGMRLDGTCRIRGLLREGEKRMQYHAHEKGRTKWKDIRWLLDILFTTDTFET